MTGNRCPPGQTLERPAPCVADIGFGVVADYLVVTPDTPLVRLLDRVVELDRVDSVFVVTQTGQLCGTIPVIRLVSRLFSVQAPAEGGRAVPALRPGTTRIRDIMDLKPRYVTGTTSLGEVASVMTRAKIGTLPVVDGRMRLRGGVSLRVLIAAFLGLEYV